MIEDYAKWLFATTAIVASLGAGFSNAAFSKLEGHGIWIFGVAILLVGLGLAFAAMSLAPKWVTLWDNSTSAMEAAVREQYKIRRKLLTKASWLFSSGLVLAAMAPLSSRFLTNIKAEPIKKVPRISVTYNLKPKGDSVIKFTAQDIVPFAPIEIKLDPLSVSTGKGMVLPRCLAIADSNGAAFVQLDLSDEIIKKAKGTLRVISIWESLEGPKVDTLKILLN